MAYQKLILVGNIGRFDDPRYTADGKLVLGFSVAYSEGKDKPTTWFNCTAFHKTAEFLQQWFKVGDGVVVEGRIECQKYTNKEGQEKESWKVSVDKATFGSGKRDSQDSSEQRPSASPAKKVPAAAPCSFNDMDSDIPFMRHGHRGAGVCWRSM